MFDLDEYPYNLLDALTLYKCSENYHLEMKALTEDQLSGLESALALLSERDRTVLKQRFQEKRTLQEIADKLGITVSYARALITKALLRLKTPKMAMMILKSING